MIGGSRLLLSICSPHSKGLAFNGRELVPAAALGIRLSAGILLGPQPD
jgi:hypothetical protein